MAEDDNNNGKWGIIGRIVDRFLKAELWQLVIIYPPFVIAWAFFAMIIWKNWTGEIDTFGWLWKGILSKDTEIIEQQRALSLKRDMERQVLLPLLGNTAGARVSVSDIHNGVQPTSINIAGEYASLVAEVNADGYGPSPIIHIPFDMIPGHRSLMIGQCVADRVDSLPQSDINGVKWSVICPIKQTLNGEDALDMIIAVHYAEVPDFTPEQKRQLLELVAAAAEQIERDFGK